MGEIARGSDGRRLFTAEFKSQQIGRVLRGELTHSELCRELDIKSSVVSRWRRLVEQGSQVAVSANEDVVPASQLRGGTGAHSRVGACSRPQDDGGRDSPNGMKP